MTPARGDRGVNRRRRTSPRPSPVILGIAGLLAGTLLVILPRSAAALGCGTDYNCATIAVSSANDNGSGTVSDGNGLDCVDTSNALSTTGCVDHLQWPISQTTLQVTVTETAAAGSLACADSESCASPGVPYVTSPYDLVNGQSVAFLANFVVEQFQLAIEAGGAGGGSVSTDGQVFCALLPCQSDATEPYGFHTVTARPDGESAFGGWNKGGPCAGKPASCTFLLSADTTLTVTFNRRSPSTSSTPKPTSRPTPAPTRSPQDLASPSLGTLPPSATAVATVLESPEAIQSPAASTTASAAPVALGGSAIGIDPALLLACGIAVAGLAIGIGIAFPARRRRS